MYRLRSDETESSKLNSHIYLDGIYLKKNWGGTIEIMTILVAIGVISAGNREIFGAAEGGKEDKESWLKFLHSLKARGLSGTRVMVGENFSA